MKKKPISLSLQNPCQQDWEAMPRQNGGLYCSDCKKVVHDFSLLSDEQIIQLFRKKSSGDICGKFRVDQLNRDLVPATSKQFSLRPAKILLLSLFSLKFIGETNAAPNHIASANYFEQKNYSKVAKRISGKATDILTGQPLQNISITLVGHLLSTTTDSLGQYQLIIPDSIHDEKFTLHAESSGYWMSDMIVNKTQLPFVANLSMTKIIEIVSNRPEYNNPPVRQLGGVPEIQYEGERSVGGDITVHHTFWQRMKLKFRRKSHN